MSTFLTFCFKHLRNDYVWNGPSPAIALNWTVCPYGEPVYGKLSTEKQDTQAFKVISRMSTFLTSTFLTFCFKHLRNDYVWNGPSPAIALNWTVCPYGEPVYGKLSTAYRALFERYIQALSCCSRCREFDDRRRVGGIGSVCREAGHRNSKPLKRKKPATVAIRYVFEWAPLQVCDLDSNL